MRSLFSFWKGKTIVADLKTFRAVIESKASMGAVYVSYALAAIGIMLISILGML